MSTTNYTYDLAFEHARHDVVSDAEFAVLHDPRFYIKKYSRICKDKEYSDDVLKGFNDGINKGFDEAL